MFETRPGCGWVRSRSGSHFLERQARCRDRAIRDVNTRVMSGASAYTFRGGQVPWSIGRFGAPDAFLRRSPTDGVEVIAVCDAVHTCVVNVELLVGVLSTARWYHFTPSHRQTNPLLTPS